MMLLNPPHSPQRDETPIQYDYRARFYDDYRKVAEEYDKEFLKKHDEDLNTTLIFVGPTWVFGETGLTGGTGWFILCSRFRVYHRRQLPASTRSQRRDCRSPSSSDLQD